MLGSSFKETRSSYAPEKGLRYDGIYRIEECWRKVGIQVNMCNQLYKNFVFGLFFSKVNSLILFSHVRVSKSVDIYLSDVIMILPHGRGLCLVTN